MCDSQIINIATCPQCFLIMSNPGRSPMCINPCGHTICSKCLSKTKTCPVCQTSINSTVENLSISDLASYLESANLLEKDINPSLKRTSSKPCTFHTNNYHAEQRWYHCLTCKILGKDVICESCINCCHINHEVNYAGTGTNTCSCGLGKILTLECKCVPIDEYTKCSLKETSKSYVKQRWYHCSTCNLVGNFGICQNCALKCHKDHNVFYSNSSLTCFCDCPSRSSCSCIYE